MGTMQRWTCSGDATLYQITLDICFHSILNPCIQFNVGDYRASVNPEEDMAVNEMDPVDLWARL